MTTRNQKLAQTVNTFLLSRTIGRVQWCELRDDSKAGAGWDVMVLEDGGDGKGERAEAQRPNRRVGALKERLRKTLDWCRTAGVAATSR